MNRLFAESTYDESMFGRIDLEVIDPCFGRL